MYMLKTVIGVLLVLSALSFDITLPSLIKRSYHGVSHQTINVTVGEHFSLPLPLFDSPWTNDNFHTFELKQEQFKQKKYNNSQFVPMDYLPFNCSLREGSTVIWDKLKHIPEDYSRARVSNWVENSYVLINSRSLLYVLNTGASELSAFIFNEHSMERITTYKLNKIIDESSSNSDISISPPVLATDAREEFLYIFSSLGVWVVDTKTVLSNVRSMGSISGFNSAKWGGVDKVLHGQSGVFLALKKMDRVFIIPEKSSDPQIQYNYTEITQFQGNKIFPQDIAILGSFIYIVDFYKGVFVYERINHNQLQPRMVISLTSFGGNYQFKVYGGSIFVNFNDIDGSKVAQISLDLGSSTFNLVRFYKSTDFINTLKIFTVPTSYFLQNPEYRDSESSLDTFMFLLLNNQDLEIYPFNLDPRIIRHAYNSLKLKGSQVRQFFHIATDRFVIVTQDSIQYVRLRINRPTITCTAQAKDDSQPQNYYLVQLTTNTSTCEHQDHSQPTKRHSYEYCQLQMDYYIHIGNPEASQHRKAMLYGIVIVVVFGFVVGLLCLMQWRNNKMVILGRLRNEIMNFRNRHKRMQPFVEENYDHKEIEIDVPKIEAVLEEPQEPKD